MFGAVLLTEETIEAFRWAFKVFATAMGGKHPQTVLTGRVKFLHTNVVVVDDVIPLQAYKHSFFYLIGYVQTSATR